MNHTTALPSSRPLSLKRQPGRSRLLALQQAVQTLALRRGETAWLAAEQGRVWVTRDGLPDDYFLDAGQCMAFNGPARLRVSAESGKAQLRISP